MEEIKIFRQMQLKELVTEEMKAKELQQLQEALRTIDEAIQKIREKRSSVLTQASIRGLNDREMQQLRTKLDESCRDFYVQRDQLMAQLDALAKLEVGAYIDAGTAEGPVTLRVGQALTEATGTMLTLKDGAIKEIKK